MLDEGRQKLELETVLRFPGWYPGQTHSFQDLRVYEREQTQSAASTGGKEAYLEDLASLDSILLWFCGDSSLVWMLRLSHTASLAKG